MEHRRTRRFQLDLPLNITRNGAARVSFTGRTKNISSSGVLFTMGRHADLGGPIEYVITLVHDNSLPPVNIRCVGKVMRSVPTEADEQDRDGYEIAATLERYEFVRERARLTTLPQTG